MKNINKITLEEMTKAYKEHNTIAIIKDGKLKGFTKERKNIKEAA